MTKYQINKMGETLNPDRLAHHLMELVRRPLGVSLGEVPS